MKRTYPIGAELIANGDVDFRVWAPHASVVAVQLELPAKDVTIDLAAEGGGYFSGRGAEIAAGTRYRYLLDGQLLCPDPASRFQPEGPHGPSEIVDPAQFQWTDGPWLGVTRHGQVIYEMHVGTFTKEGSWKSASEHLPYLAELGITIIELMPVADFPGSFGWGYDGVNLFAPCRLYGTPDDMRHFVNLAHELGIGVILDVVYNHLGPDGNYLKSFADSYFSTRYKNEWGEAINFDGEDSGPVREFFETNAVYWIEEFHLDGLRLDATQQIFDASEDHILAVIERRTREAAQGRGVVLIAENECQHTELVRSVSDGGLGLDALWNDDFHHTALVALTGRSEAYYTDYKGSPQEFISALKWGYLYQGQRYAWQKQRRGHPAFGLEPSAFVNYIENHDQVANTGSGLRPRFHTSPGRYRAITALLLLAPGTPMLFQGQEFGATAPFYYFADHNEALSRLVYAGRREFLCQFPSMATAEMQAKVVDPAARETFEQSILNHDERDTHGELLALHRDLLRIRRFDPTISRQAYRTYDGAVLSPESFVVRMFGEWGDRLLVINLGRDLALEPAPEPLLAPPMGSAWRVLWSSEDPEYGGNGVPAIDKEEIWRLSGESATLYHPIPYTEAKKREE